MGHPTEVVSKLLATVFVCLLVISTIVAIGATNHRRLHSHHQQHQQQQQQQQQHHHHHHNHHHHYHDSEQTGDNNSNPVQTDNDNHLSSSTYNPLVDHDDNNNNNNHHDYQQTTQQTSNEQWPTLVDVDADADIDVTNQNQIWPAINQRLCPRRCSKRLHTVLNIPITKYIVPSPDEHNPSNGKLITRKIVSSSSICGSDKKHYPTYCHMQRASCRTRRIIRPVDPSVCQSSVAYEHVDGAIVSRRSESLSSRQRQQQQQQQQQSQDIDTNEEEDDDQYNVISDSEIDQDDLDEELDDDDLIDGDLEAIIKRNSTYYDTIKAFELALLKNRLQLPETTNNNSATVIDESKQICNRQLYNQMMLKIATLSEKDSSEIFQYFDKDHDHRISPNELLLDNTNGSRSLFFVRQTNKDPLVNIRGNYILEPLFDDNPCSLSHILLYEDRNRDDVIDLDEMTIAFRRIWPNVPDKQIEPNVDGDYAQKTQNIQKNTVVSSYKRHIVNLGDSLRISCNLSSITNSIQDKSDKAKIEWLRNGVQLDQGQLTINSQQQSMMTYRQLVIDQEDWSLLLRDIQLFMAGNYTCRRQFDQYSSSTPSAVIYEQHHYLHVFVSPKVTVRPGFQWAPIGSQAQLECQYEYLSLFTDDGAGTIKIKWFKNGQELEDSRGPITTNNYPVTINNNSTSSPDDDDGFYEYDSQLSSNVVSTSQEASSPETVRSSFVGDDKDNNNNRNDVAQNQEKQQLEKSSSISVSMSSSRLTINPLTPTDTGSLSCQASLNYYGDNNNLMTLAVSDYGSLLVQDDPARIATDELDSGREHLWLFHDNGITIYSISMNGADDQMQLIRDFTGHNTIAPQIDNNWNQLTLCGGLNPDEAVICEWSDNAVIVTPQYLTPFESVNQRRRHRGNKQSLGYVYVGQPNLNRVLVFDSQQFEIVSILNTDPQPKQLWLYNTIDYVPVSRLRSPMENYRNKLNKKRKNNRQATSSQAQYRSDIWILCHGQPLVVDTTNTNININANNNNVNLLDARQAEVTSDFSNIKYNNQIPMPIKYNNNLDQDQSSLVSEKQKIDYYWQQQMLSKEQRLRNRKSVQIIRTSTRSGEISHRHGDTLMKNNNRRLHNRNHHYLNYVDDIIDRNQSVDESSTQTTAPISNSVKRFKSTTSIASYHLKSDHPFSLIHDLYMPHVATPLIDNYHHHVQYAYVSHYDERKLVRIDMDMMASDKIFDLGDCVPVYQLTTATGLLIIQCRTPITHQLKGQLILDQLTNSFISYNPDIQAQRSFLSPDHRYLVSIYIDYNYSNNTSETSSSDGGQNERKTNQSKYDSQHHNTSQNRQNQTTAKRFVSAKLIVQKVKPSGLEFQYDVNTSLFIIDCAFVWKNGDYDAILVSDLGQQDEILSLRLLDGRVELISGILGRISNQHSSLKVSERSKMAAIATNKGVYVLDMEDNRVKCQVPKHHQFTSATLLWA